MSLLAALAMKASVPGTPGGGDLTGDPADLAAFPPPPAPDAYPWTPITTFLAPGAEGYSNSRVHPTVVDVGPQKWNGYRYWMADTPYPPEPMEDPHVWASNDRLTWVEPEPGMTNPIMDRLPERGVYSYNSDPELQFDPTTGTMYLWNRWVGIDYPTKGTNTIELWTFSSTDGKAWTNHGVVAGPVGLSPAVVRHPSGKWYRYDMAGYVRYEADAPLGPWTNQTPVTYNGPGTMRHGDVIYHDGLWWAMGAEPGGIVSCFISRDGLNFRGSRGVVIGDWVKGGYRPTITPSNVPGYMDVWCSVTGGKEAYTSTYTRIPLTWWTSLLQ